MYHTHIVDNYTVCNSIESLLTGVYPSTVAAGLSATGLTVVLL